MAKRVIVEATLPELKGGDIYKTGRGEGTSWPVAVHRAMVDIQQQLRKKKKGAKRAGGKTLTVIKATISIMEVKENPDATQDGQAAQDSED